MWGGEESEPTGLDRDQGAYRSLILRQPRTEKQGNFLPWAQQGSSKINSRSPPHRPTSDLNAYSCDVLSAISDRTYFEALWLCAVHPKQKTEQETMCQRGFMG